ncbi:beta-lactamase family protein [Staphylococcus simiae]|uniref:serine hydrolase domain-containing protein n=1 Tax=Staphylococcus simiae TaxID=308354 RepID=UPI001A95B509|nr:serine hydrolase domain-containing protein [Staphylococcus simiae]MBO1198546.1 beta-lactamase family protein [Staphylococcus simiae]MBO1200656.1 beta-lactamase family protein [Staphylococcus simiae]MBO1202952.1 beta-lactamase family protein [Staphylococcus simiae]MBO1210537.1 beta-lactamase family protein [Staphylococcus simiae]MBO1229018.1 beta-lactamase family protein [Staphylococcus simiae]
MTIKNLYFISIIVIMITAIILSVYLTTTSNTKTLLTHDSEQHVDTIIKHEMNKGHIPGASVLIIKDGKVFLNKGYGYQNIADKEKVTPNTKFEIASNTKAFTGLAILQLAEQHKLNLNDSISKYIPNFHMTYKDKKQDITIKQLLNHTSGISGDITSEDKVTTKHNQLSDLTKEINGKALDDKPGDTFNYANMNYDLLGLIIQHVSNQSYQQYMTEHWLKPLHMSHTSFKTSNSKNKMQATGYELEGTTPHATKPEFNSWDTPAAFMMTSTNDLEKWMKLQLDPPSKYQNIVKQSHQTLAKATGEPNANGYASGWFTNDDEHIAFHQGTLDNFSSYILLNNNKHYGIVVLANLNSEYIPSLIDHISTQIINNDHYSTVENALSHHSNDFNIITVIATAILLLCATMMGYRVWRIKHHEISLRKLKYTSIVSWLCIFIIVMLLVVIYLLPYFILGSNDWMFVLTWLPNEIKVDLISIVLALLAILMLSLLVLNSGQRR